MSTIAGPHVRLATPDEIEELVSMSQRAFYRSPPQTFFSGVTTPLKTDESDYKRQNNQRKFLRLLFRRSQGNGTRITVVVVSGTGENEREQIVASAIWRPPITAGHKPLSTFATLRLGLVPVLMAWGFGAVKRITEFINASKSSLDREFAARGLQGTPDDAWYLQLICVDPDFQGKGYMSMLIREAIEKSPGAIFTLESTTPYSRDRYEHLGFQVIEEVIVGKGKADSGGVVTSAEAATGFPIYPMIKT